MYRERDSGRCECDDGESFEFSEFSYRMYGFY